MPAASTLPTTGLVDQFMLELALWAGRAAQSAVASLTTAFGDSTEPDFSAIRPVYDRMLAIALLLTGAVIACGLIEHILGGSQGLRWNLIPRTVAALSFAFLGLGLVQYLAHYAALLATTWSPDLLGIHHQLGLLGSPSVPAQANGQFPSAALGSLIVTALLTNLMAVLVYLELVVRGALILIVTAFIPLVCALAIWPRMATTATALGEFLVGLLLSKFVVATAIYIGYGLILPHVLSGDRGDWMATGLAILFIAAFAPVVLFQGLRFAHGAAGAATRDWILTGVSMTPWVATLGAGTRLVRGAATSVSRSLGGSISRNTKRSRSR